MPKFHLHSVSCKISTPSMSVTHPDLLKSLADCPASTFGWLCICENFTSVYWEGDFAKRVAFFLDEDNAGNPQDPTYSTLRATLLGPLLPFRALVAWVVEQDRGIYRALSATKPLKDKQVTNLARYLFPSEQDRSANPPKNILEAGRYIAIRAKTLDTLICATDVQTYLSPHLVCRCCVPRQGPPGPVLSIKGEDLMLKVLKELHDPHVLLYGVWDTLITAWPTRSAPTPVSTTSQEVTLAGLEELVRSLDKASSMFIWFANLTSMAVGIKVLAGLQVEAGKNLFFRQPRLSDTVP